MGAFLRVPTSSAKRRCKASANGTAHYTSYIKCILRKELNMHKSKGPPDLDKYLEGRKHKYMTYQQAARHYGLPYWGFVKVAKEAKATWKLRKLCANNN